MPYLLGFLESLEPCWKDRACLATAAGIASGVAVLGRRWDVLHRVKRRNTRDRVAFVFGGAMVNMVASFFLVMIGVKLWPLTDGHEFAVPIVVFGAIAIDWGSDSGIELIRRIFKRGLAKWVGIDLDKLEDSSSSQASSSRATTGNRKTDSETN